MNNISTMNSITTERNFLNNRKNGIGGSDVASIVPTKGNIKTFKTRVEVWNDKISDEVKISVLRPDDKTSRMWYGKRFEAIILEDYAFLKEDKGQEIKMQAFTDNDTPFFHKEHHWLIANLDAIATIDGEKVIVDAKFITNDFDHKWGEPNTDQLPFQYKLQLQHYMYVLDIDRAEIAAVIAGQLYIYKMERNRQIYDETIFPWLKYFWFHNVKKRIPPEPTKLSDVRLSYKSEGTCIKASNDIIKSDGNLEKLKEQEKTIKDKIDAEKIKITSYMKESDILVDQNGTELFTFKENKKGVRTLLTKKRKQS